MSVRDRFSSRKRLPMAGAVIVAVGLLTASAVPAADQGSLPGASQDGMSLQQKDFASLDVNGDGVLAPHEYYARDYAKGSFKKADMDGKGVLNETEYVNARSISERMTVKDYVDDAWITTKVKGMLLKDEILSGLQIQVDTSNGIVQLSGWVNSQDQVDRAASIAQDVKGVRRVENDILVKNRS